VISLYRDKDDWWVGYYRGKTHHYVCLLPTLVIRWDNKKGQQKILNLLMRRSTYVPPPPPPQWKGRQEKGRQVT